MYIFQNANDALSAHFRPCKRCRPLDKRLPDQTWVDQITEFIDKHYSDPLTLQTIADRCHGSPYHLHRTFKRIKGMTPSEYIQQLRIGKAARTLIQTNQKINDIAKATGIPNTSYFITVFKKMTGLTPNEYRYYKKGYSDFMVEKDL